MWRQWKKYSTLLLLVFFAGAASATVSLAAHLQEKLSLPASGLATLAVDSDVNQLTINTLAGATTIEVELILPDGPAQSTGYSVTLNQVENIASLKVKPVLYNKVPVDLIVTVPDSLALKLNDGNSDVTINNVSGEVRVHDGSGNLNFYNVNKLKIVDKSGDILVDNSGITTEGSIMIQDGSGMLSVNNVKGAVNVSDKSGNIEVRNITGDVVIRDGSGDLVVSNVSQKVTIDDGSGNITVDSVQDLTVLESGSGLLNYSGVKGKINL